MQILLITPPGPSSRTGNQVAAERWAKILRKLGHRVRVAAEYKGESPDLMVAIHAWRSVDSIVRFRERHPESPLVLQLSGTDIYHYLAADPEPTLRSMELADCLVALNGEAWRAVPKPLRAKLRVIYQSVEKPPPGTKTRPDLVEISVIGHLREVKDPLRAAEAARLLPAQSRVRIVQAGAAYSSEWALRARAEMARNPRYLWRGDLPRRAVQALLQRSRALVVSSLSEGGANVVSEAAVAHVPILASRMPGNVGLLGTRYAGYFPVGDTARLARLLRRVEHDATFVAKLRRAVAARAPLFRPSREVAEWKKLLAWLARRSGSARAPRSRPRHGQ